MTLRYIAIKINFLGEVISELSDYQRDDLKAEIKQLADIANISVLQDLLEEVL
jgi:hypothetical protein